MSIERYYPGDFIGFFGELRQGKSMGAIRLLLMLRQAGYSALANINTQLAPRSNTLEEYLNAKGKVLFIDEIQKTFNSRLFKDNAELIEDINFLGKDGNIVLYTAPHISQVDIRVRQVTGWMYTAERIRPGLSVLTRAKISAGGMVTPRGKFILRHARFGPLYDTLDKSVKLVPRDGRAGGGRPPRPRGSAAGGSSSPPVGSGEWS